MLERDVTNTESIERVMQTVVKDRGRLDVLVNNAGVAYAGIMEGFTPEQATVRFVR